MITMSAPEDSQRNVAGGVWCVLVGSIVLLGWSIFTLGESFAAPGNGDLKRMWGAAGVFWEGGNPYDNRAVTAFSVARGYGETVDLPLYLPPVAFPYLLPLAVDSFDVVRNGYVFAVALVVVVMAGLPFIRRSKVDRNGIVLSLAALLSFFPLLLMVWVGPLSWWPVVGLGVYSVLVRRSEAGARFTGGLALMMMLVKPNCAPLVLPFTLGFSLVRGRWAELGGMIAGLVIGAYGMRVLTLEPQFLDSIAATGTWITAAPLRALGWPNSPLVVRFLPVAVCGVWALWFGARTRDVEAFSARIGFLIVPLGLCITPFAWTYDFTPLVLMISALSVLSSTGCRAREGHRVVNAALSILIALNTVLIVSPLAMRLHWWYPLGFLITGVWVYYRLYSACAGMPATGRASTP